MTMTRFQVVAIAAGLLLAISGPSFAAQRTHQKSQTHATTAAKSQPRAAKSSGSANSWNGLAIRPYSPNGTSDYPWGPGYNFPYPDRPYGDPGRW
jgi:hypothetical protein